MNKSEYQLPAHLMPYLVNGDTDNMSEEEVTEIKTFIDGQVKENNFTQFNVVAPNTEPYFSHTNDFNSLGGDVYDCIVITS